MLCCVDCVCCGVQLVAQCDDEDLMDIVLPRLTRLLSVWELLLAKVHTLSHTHTHRYVPCPHDQLHGFQLRVFDCGISLGSKPFLFTGK